MPIVSSAVVAMLLAPSSVSESQRVGLQWSAPAACPSQDAVAEELHVFTGHPIAVGRGADRAVRGRVEHAVDGFVLDLEVSAGGMTRSQRLRSSRCDTLGTAAALVATIEFEMFLATPSPVPVPSKAPPPATLVAPLRPPSTRGRSLEAEPAAEPRPTSQGLELEQVDPLSAPQVEPQEADNLPTPLWPPSHTLPLPPVDASVPDDEDNPRPRRTSIFAAASHRFVASVAAGPSFGFAPGATGLLLGRLGWRFGPLQVDATGFHHFARSRNVVSDASIVASLSGAKLRGCAIFDARSVEIPLCAGLALASLRTEPSGDVSGTSTDDLWVSASVGTGVAWAPVPRFALVLDLAASFALRRPGVHWTVLGERQLAFRSPQAGFSAVFGPQIRLP